MVLKVLAYLANTTLNTRHKDVKRNPHIIQLLTVGVICRHATKNVLWYIYGALIMVHGPYLHPLEG